jgi:hypothetical protein
MSCLRASAVVVSALALCLASPALKADGDDKTPTHVTVAFGTGNNNAQPGNTPNHHILPMEIKVRISQARKLSGEVVSVPATVNFIVSGVHWIWVYRPGVSLQEVVDHIPLAGFFVNYEVVTLGVSNVFAKGIFPGTPTAVPPFSDAMPFPFSGAQNRTDSIAFSTPGRYLVICNVVPHFVDGMYAWVRVVDDDDDHDDHEGHGHH